MKKAEKLKYFEQIMWDSSISPEEIAEIFEGRQNNVRNYDKSALFKRILESYPWFTVIQLFSITQIAELLTDDVIAQLRSASLRRQYNYANKRLQRFL
jgi:hypothetical protein